LWSSEGAPHLSNQKSEKMKKEKIRGIGHNQNPITDQLEKALSIIRKDVFSPICDPDLTFREADKASEKCLEANDLIRHCIQILKGSNDKR
jgi:hypothetical protein